MAQESICGQFSFPTHLQNAAVLVKVPSRFAFVFKIHCIKFILNFKKKMYYSFSCLIKKIGARDLTQWQSACLSCTGLDGRGS